MRKSVSGRAAIPGPRPTPADERAASATAATAAMAALPEAQREILRLRLVEGLAADEVAERLAMTAAAVRLAQHRALEALRAGLRA
jgi:RNA polymerase sigma-70 factor, ECF subfamily